MQSSTMVIIGPFDDLKRWDQNSTFSDVDQVVYPIKIIKSRKNKHARQSMTLGPFIRKVDKIGFFSETRNDAYKIERH